MLAEAPVSAAPSPLDPAERLELERRINTLGLTPDQAELIVDESSADPLFFIRYILGKRLWRLQRRIARALMTPHARVAVKACHSSGKTALAAWLAIWWLMAGGIAITTAPTWTQVRKLIWVEIARAKETALYQLGGELHQTEWKVPELGPDAYAMGLSTNQGVRFQGFHGRILIIGDEAAGIIPPIWESIEGVRAGGDVRLLFEGNPILAYGPFFDLFHEEDPGWERISIDAFDTPNLRGLTLADLNRMAAECPEELDNNPFPFLTTRRWVYDLARRRGEGSAIYKSRVHAIFPVQSEDSLISQVWIDRGLGRIPNIAGETRIVGGVDVGGGGLAETVVALVQGPNLVAMEGWNLQDDFPAVDAYLRPHKPNLAALRVDVVGVGHNFANRLAAAGYPVVRVNVGRASRHPKRFVNRKAEAYWTLRDRLEAHMLGNLRVGGPDLISQLAMLRYSTTSREQVAMESKESLARRGIASPDHAEALMLAAADFDDDRIPAGLKPVVIHRGARAPVAAGSGVRKLF